MGPLRLLDFVGLDVAESIGDSLHAESSDPVHQVPDTIRSLVAEGKLGRKSGAGFYDYEDE
jgi:3-hydroxybutyryl-CoA dehydrogenase